MAYSTQIRSRYSPLNVLKFFGQISYSLYLWHWPLFTFARFSKSSLALDREDRIALFGLTVVISYLSWRFVEQPLRRGSLVPTRRAAFRLAAFSTAVLLAGTAGGIVISQRLTDVDRAALQLESYNSYNFSPVYRYGSCYSPVGYLLGDVCLALASGKTNLLLWGDSLAAHYFHGLSKAVDPQAVHILQATQAQCMPTLNAAAQTDAACRILAGQMDAFFRDSKPELVVMSANWLLYGRRSWFNGMIADIKQTISRLNGLGITVVLLGPGVQFKSGLPSILTRAHLRLTDARPEDFVLPDIFSLDEKMKSRCRHLTGFPTFLWSMRSARRSDARSQLTTGFHWHGITRISPRRDRHMWRLS